MQGNIRPLFNFALSPLLSVGEFKTERIQMSQIKNLFFNTTVSRQIHNWVSFASIEGQNNPKQQGKNNPVNISSKIRLTCDDMAVLKGVRVPDVQQ